MNYCWRDSYTFHKDKKNYYRCTFSEKEHDKNGKKVRKYCSVRIKEIDEKGEKHFYYTKGSPHNHNHKPKFNNKQLVNMTLDRIIKNKDYLEYDLMVILTRTYEESWGISKRTYLKKLTERIQEEKNRKRIEFMKDKDIYILYEEDDFIIVYDPMTSPYINLCDNLYCDGTFKIAPIGMYQLYTVHGLLDGTVYPLFYCLMKNKMAKTYDNMFSIINQATGELFNTKQMTIMGDFEVANFNFLENKNLKFCYFHYCQILKRTRTKLCSSELVNDLMVLPLVPENRLESIYEFIVDKYMRNENSKFIHDRVMINMFEQKFFKRYNYMNWNVSTEEHKTNNLCESYHRTLNSFFKHKKMELEDFIPKLIEYIIYRRERIVKGIDEEFCRNKKSEEKRREIKNIIENEHSYTNEELLEKIKTICYRYKRVDKKLKEKIEEEKMKKYYIKYNDKEWVPKDVVGKLRALRLLPTKRVEMNNKGKEEKKPKKKEVRKKIK